MTDNFTSGYKPKRTERRDMNRHLHTHVHSSVIYIISKRQKHPMSMGAWINKEWYIQTMKYYSALKRKKIPMCATTWMDLERIMINEINQS